jgi:hypothetical protein
MHQRRYRPDERARLVLAFRASGLKQKDFAVREGITVGALQNWLYSPKAKLTPGPPAQGGFVRVVGARASPQDAVVVRLGEAVAIAFESMPDANYLAALARALAC